MLKTIVEEIDFDEDGKPSIDFENQTIVYMRTGQFYKAVVSNRRFVKNEGSLFWQWDPPNTNSCYYQKAWLVLNDRGLRSGESILLCAGINTVKLSRDLELEYAKKKRAYAIKYRCTFRDVRITEESPIEAWLYNPTVDPMPRKAAEDDE